MLFKNVQYPSIYSYSFDTYMGLIGFEPRFYHLLAARSPYKGKDYARELLESRLCYWD
jgi:hypothetical protein